MTTTNDSVPSFPLTDFSTGIFATAARCGELAGHVDDLTGRLKAGNIQGGPLPPALAEWFQDPAGGKLLAARLDALGDRCDELADAARQLWDVVAAAAHREQPRATTRPTAGTPKPRKPLPAARRTRGKKRGR